MECLPDGGPYRLTEIQVDVLKATEACGLIPQVFSNTTSNPICLPV